MAGGARGREEERERTLTNEKWQDGRVDGSLSFSFSLTPSSLPCAPPPPPPSTYFFKIIFICSLTFPACV